MSGASVETIPARTHVGLFDELIEGGQFVEAAQHCSAAIESDPDDYAPYLNLGRLAEIAGDSQKASEYFAEAIVRNVECGVAFAGLSRSLRKLGQLPFAVRALQVAIEMKAVEPGAWLDLADMFFEMGDNESARRAYQTVLENRPNCSRSRAILKLVAPTAGVSTTPDGRWTIPAGWRRVHISIIAPDGYPHWQGFSKTAESFAQALAELGIETSASRNEMIENGVNIIFGAHLISSQEAANQILARSVVFNLEQISGFGLDKYPVYRDIVGRLAVWDYSRRNIQKLKQFTGNQSIVPVHIGYTTNLTCVSAATDQTTDVLFFGSLNTRRNAVLEELRSFGLNVKHVFNVYGKDLDAEVARAKIVLNVHFYDDNIHEIVRTSYLMANRKAIVSECHKDTEIEDDIRSAMHAVPYDALARACYELVRNPTERSALETAAFEIFSRRSQAGYLARAISETAETMAETG